MELGRIWNVRASAQIRILSLLVDGNSRSVNLGNQLGLVGISRKELQRVGFGHIFAGNLFASSCNLAHLGFYLGQIFLSDCACSVYVVVKAVFYRRADSEV